MTRQLIIALTVAFVSVPGARAQSGHVAKVLIALENVWVEALVQADTAKLEAIFLDTYKMKEGISPTNKARWRC